MKDVWMRSFGSLVAVLALAGAVRAASEASVISAVKISELSGGFGGDLDDLDLFGSDVAFLGDVDGDGTGDIAVGARRDGDGGNGNGAVWILFLDRDGTVKSEQKISDLEGGFTGDLEDGDYFGSSVAAIGDLDGNGVTELAVGARQDNDGAVEKPTQAFHLGAVWILFLESDGRVSSHQKISQTSGGFTGLLESSDFFGASVAGIGDLDGDGVPDIAVGATGDDQAGPNLGALWVVFLNADGTVKSVRKNLAPLGSFSGGLFGSAVDGIGDFNGDGRPDLVVGHARDFLIGAVWIMYMSADGSFLLQHKIGPFLPGGFPAGVLEVQDEFGIAVASLGDINGDGVTDLAVGADRDNDGGENRGAIWILFMKNDATVDSVQKISSLEGGFEGELTNGDNFGISVTAIDDLNGDGVPELSVGARLDDDGGADPAANLGAVWNLFIGVCEVGSPDFDCDGVVGFNDLISVLSTWGPCVDCPQDLDGDGVVGFSDLIQVLSNWS